MYPTIQSNSIGHAVLAGIFYVLMVGLLIYSLLTIYTLIRFGRNRLLTLILSVVYLVFLAILYSSAVGNLGNINF